MTRWRGLLPALLTVAMLSLLSVGAISAAEDAPQAEPPAIDFAGGEEDDAFHISDETLATSIFIPAIFVGATLWVFVWAVRARARASDDDLPMPWWRTRQWYTRGSEEEEA